MKYDVIQKDIELCETVLNGSKMQQKDVYYSLQGKYRDIPLSQLQVNPLYLQHHPDEYRNCILVIKSYLQTLLLAATSSNEDNDETNEIFSKVFIVHGHDEALKQAVARLIEKQGIKAIILHEQTNQGATIIEKFEKNSNVGAAICLFTADDIGGEKDEQTRNKRARQNVVFEAGFFIGRLGRKHVIIMAEHDVELPSDMKGIVYTNSSSWQLEVLRE